MNRVSVYQVPVTPDVLSGAAAASAVPPALVEPLQSLVAAVTHRAADAPVRLYVCADDDAAAARDGFASVLARALAPHIPSTLVVDCDFLRIGLSGMVPQADALGLLDFLLYGSSIGVVTQEAVGGVHVVGAGSFPVTKRMPFVVPAFDEAARRLAAHARCAIFVGPLVQEDGSAHPLALEVSAAVVVRTDDAGAVRTPRSGAQLDAIEESIAERGIEVWSVRAAAAVEKRRAPEPTPAVKKPYAATPPVAAAARTVPAADKPAVSASPAAEKPPAARPRASDPAPTEAPEPRYSTLLPRIAVLVFAALVIAFVAWWMLQGRSRVGDEERTAAKPVAPVDTTRQSAVPPVQRDTVLATVDTATSAAATPPKPTVPAPTQPASRRASDTGGGTGGTVLVDPSDILVMDDLARRWNGWYAIHISSFQESIQAREEVAFLQSREFPVFIVFLDLGPKGKWYRVYAGPFETREQARDVKKNLDAIPQVRFTRVTRIPE